MLVFALHHAIRVIRKQKWLKGIYLIEFSEQNVPFWTEYRKKLFFLELNQFLLFNVFFSLIKKNRK